MGLLSKVGIFVVIILLSNYLVSLVFKYIAKKSKAVHLRFTKSAINVIIDVIGGVALAELCFYLGKGKQALNIYGKCMDKINTKVLRL